MDYCVACGAFINFDTNHHCDPKRIDLRDMVMQRGREPDEAPNVPFYLKLAVGVQMMSGAK